MIINVTAAAQFAADRPVTQLIADNKDCRVVVFGFAPGQSIPLHTSPATVLMQVVEGFGQIQVGAEQHPVGPGDLAVCPPMVPHALAAGEHGRLIIVATIVARP